LEEFGVPPERHARSRPIVGTYASCSVVAGLGEAGPGSATPATSPRSRLAWTSPRGSLLRCAFAAHQLGPARGSVGRSFIGETYSFAVARGKNAAGVQPATRRNALMKCA
jgi:hypothetical protein